MIYKELGDFVTLSQGLAINSGTKHLVNEEKNEEFVYPLLRIADMMENTFTKYISKDVNPSVIANKDDIIYTRTGQIGLAFRGYNGVVHNNSFIVSLTNDELDKDYLFTLLQSDFVKEQALKLAKNSVQPDLTHDMFKSIVIPVPSKCIQIKIAKTYNELSGKIENNNKINAELESMAKTIYDYWFLQFEFPNEEGKPYKSSGGKMVWNEELKCEIPEGWEVSDLSKYINVIRGVAYDTEDITNQETAGYIPLLKSNNLQNDRLILDDIVYVKKENVAEDQILENNSIFVTMSSGSTEHVGKTAIIFYDMPYTYGAFCSKINIKPKYRGFISMFFLSDYFKKKIRTIVVGTSIKNINNSHLTGNTLAFPNEDILGKFEKIIAPIFDKEGEIIKENQELASLRDFLLPMLMNGQIGFKDGE